MTVSVSVMSSGHSKYYTSLARDDYYTREGEPPGVWLGSGSEKLSLDGAVDAAVFHQLFEGFDPKSGEKLRQNAGAAPRVYQRLSVLTGEKVNVIREQTAGYDMTFSAPKSVSVWWASSDAADRRVIENAHTEAIQEALKYLEDHESEIRRGKGGGEREAASILVGAFRHSTSRSLDPQLHTHALIINVGVGEDGKTGALDGGRFFKSQKAVGSIYHLELARRIEEGLGVQIETTKDAFEIAAVSKQVIEKFSTRRQEIETWCKEHGTTTQEAGEAAALATRESKKIPCHRDLLAKWRREAKAEGFTPQSIPRIPPERDAAEREAAFLRAEKHADTTLTQAKSTFHARDVYRAFAESLIGQNVTYQEVEKSAERYLDSARVVTLSRSGNEPVYTLASLLDIEQKMLQQLNAGKEQGTHCIPHERIAAIAKRAGLSADKEHALSHITERVGNVQVLSGLAGTGKSTTLALAREAWEGQGYQVIGVALAAVAAQNLAQASGIQSMTIAKFLKNQEPDDPSEQGRWKHEKVKMTPTTILVIDESGMVGTRQMAQLVDLVTTQGGKLVLSGDAKQLQSIESGGSHRAFASRLGEASLTIIERQREVWARDSVADLAYGRTEEALLRFGRRGLLHVEETKSQAAYALLSDWQSNGGVEAPKDHLILAATREDVAGLNKKAQSLRYQEGMVGGTRISIAGQDFYEGDRIIFTENSRKLAVSNGNRATITHVDRGRQSVTAELDTGHSVMIPLREYDKISLAYAMTTHKAQGNTVEHAYVLCGGGMQDRELSYVQISRSRENTRLYVDAATAGQHVTELVDRMERSRPQILATDVSKHELQRTPLERTL